MNYISLNKLSLELAERLLLKNGELSIQDIKGIPFLHDERDAETIFFLLKNKYQAEVYYRKISVSELPYWDEIIKLKKNE